ncbi:bifunctional methylenetetrahydrofolate dehydrogenase/methenyltetrahydrofolate cyclohydrolase FolD [bacterium]|jgi:methylenetetrahydrofolate dehydrogenase (NADP+)/methenyltetrahydrofolate cyclohydrolase|nr:bifunctional methylenetetrahydrofolate dehydrogenase/methenyltetrahydrofolate cyclohydrolase FolD [bacterium]
MLLLSAKPVTEALRKEVSHRAAQFKKKHGRAPKLSVLIVGEDPASVIYVRKKGETAEELGLAHETIRFPASAGVAEVRDAIFKLNADKNVDGILLQQPLPPTFKSEDFLLWVAPEKDVDGFHPQNLGRLMQGLPGLKPCTPYGAMKLLEHYKIEVKGKLACVVGRSVIVGKPAAQLLMQADATVIQCHSKTANLKSLTSQADILIVAAGKQELIGSEHVRKGAVVVDVGIHRKPDGKVCGDVKFEEVSKVASALTPVPGGVGPMTILMLMSNTVSAAEAREA